MQHLFSYEPLRDFLNRYKMNLQREIDSCKPEYLLKVNEEEYYNYLISKYTLATPSLQENKAHISQKKELERKNQSRLTVNNASLLSGELHLTISIPFVGVRHLFKCKPSTYTLHPPIGDIGTSEIKLHYEVAGRDPESLKKKYTEDIEEVKKYLQWIEKDLNSHNAWIESNARKYVSKRKRDLLQNHAFLRSIGLPIKRKASEVSQKPILDDAKGVDWDFFVCHASEDKESIVRELAEKLHKNGFKVWYDEFTLKLGDSLRQKIDYGLANSRYGIVVLSVSFFKKEWPQKELDGLVARERRERKVILPIWHGVTKEDVEKFSPILAGRLAASTHKGLDYVIGEIIKAIK